MDTRTNIVLDDELVAQAMVRAGVKTKKVAVEAALRAFVRKPDYSGLLALVGSGVIAEDYDPKAAAYQAQPHVAEPAASYGAGKPVRRRPAAKRAR